MAQKYADLEFALRRRDEQTYSPELRYNGPNSDVEQGLIVTGKSEIKFDFAALAKHESLGNWRAYGVTLSESLFAGPAGEGFRRARQDAVSKSAILRVRLLIEPGAVELHRLRWEAIGDPDNPVPLCASFNLAFSRYLTSMDWGPIRSRPRSQLKALIVIASPTDIAQFGDKLAPIPIHGENGELTRAKAALGEIASKELVSPGAPTLNNILDELANGYDILYLMCHGTLSEPHPGTFEPRLFLENDEPGKEGQVKGVSGTEFVLGIQSLPERPRLVVLASCESAGTGSSDPGAIAAALGPRLAQAGIPAVVAMDGQVAIDAAQAFMKRFFKELNEDGQIDRAMAEARLEIVNRRSEFWRPVLYLRLSSGRVWYRPGFEDGKLDGWETICTKVNEGLFVPIVGPELPEVVFGSNRDLAEKLAAKYNFPLSPNDSGDLEKVTQYAVHTKAPRKDLVDDVFRFVAMQVREKFKAESAAEPNTRKLIQTIVDKMSKDANNPYQIIATTLDRASIYVSATPDPLLAMFLTNPERTPVELSVDWQQGLRSKPTLDEEAQAPTPQRPLVFYVFGNRIDDKTWVLTEDDYFDYLIRMSKLNLMPATVGTALVERSLMFLGFPLDDWKFRILFRMILALGGSTMIRDTKHVAVQVNPDETTLADANRAKRYLEKYFGTEANLDIYWGTATDFLRDLRDQLKDRPRPTVVAAAPVQRERF
jgi:hypothetical protein